MGYDPAILHAEHIASKLTAPERAKLGVQTAAEATQRHAAREERRMHDEVDAWLRMKGIPFIHGRMDKRSTIRAGWPDFTCMMGRELLGGAVPPMARVCCVELKAPAGIISSEQAEVLAELKLAHVPAKVCYSAKEAIDFIIGELLS